MRPCRATSSHSGTEKARRGCLRADDCQRVFGGVRALQYVAQDDMDVAPGARITHRALRNWFCGYSAEVGRCGLGGMSGVLQGQR